MSDFYVFRKMMTPILIQIVFWIAVGVSLMGGFALLISLFVFAVREQTPLAFLLVIPGAAGLVVFPLLARIYCELLIVPFRIYDMLVEIKNRSPQ